VSIVYERMATTSRDREAFWERWCEYVQPFRIDPYPSKNLILISGAQTLHLVDRSEQNVTLAKIRSLLLGSRSQSGHWPDLRNRPRTKPSIQPPPRAASEKDRGHVCRL